MHKKVSLVTGNIAFTQAFTSFLGNQLESMKNDILQEELEQSRLGSIEEEKHEKKKEYDAFDAVFRTKAHLSGASTVQFSPNKKKLITSGSDGMIKVWDMRRLQNCITHDEPDRKQAYR